MNKRPTACPTKGCGAIGSWRSIKGIDYCPYCNQAYPVEKSAEILIFIKEGEQEKDRLLEQRRAKELQLRAKKIAEASELLTKGEHALAADKYIELFKETRDNNYLPLIVSSAAKSSDRRLLQQGIYYGYQYNRILSDKQIYSAMANIFQALGDLESEAQLLNDATNEFPEEREFLKRLQKIERSKAKSADELVNMWISQIPQTNCYEGLQPLEVLKKVFNFECLYPFQEQIIPLVLKKKNVLAALKTGGGANRYASNCRH